MSISDITAFIEKNVNDPKIGWANLSVHGDENSPPFSYSIGFWKTFGAPDVIIAGFQPEMGHGVLRSIADGLRKDAHFIPAGGGRRNQVITDFPVLFQPLERARAKEFARFSYKYDDPQRPLEIMQVFLPDAQGRFPGEPGCDSRYEALQSLDGLDPWVVNKPPSLH